MTCKKIIITMGDPAGIGPEVVVKSLLSPRINKQTGFIVVGDQFVLNKIKGFQRLKKGIELIDLENVGRKDFSFGKVKAEYGKAAREYIDKALDLMKERGIKALVTAPVNKQAIALTDKDFSGQTGYLAEKTNAKETAMLLANDRLKVALVTQHIPLKAVAEKITSDKIFQVIKLTNSFLKKFYRLKHPQIALCGLNPHASDNGLIGNEEDGKIIPAIKRIKAQVACCGPWPADTLFSLALANKFDAVIAMYHDQALIPLKLSAKESGVNITIGLSFIRVSPLHGTAFDIAGKNKADPSSMISAINTAEKFLKNVS